jgi:RimJ/RimL family protein N-acetyltransferase
MIDSFTTERLTAERLRPEHLELLCSVNRDPRVAATLGGVRTDEETRDRTQFHLDHWQRHGFGIWIFRARTDGRFISRAGLIHTVVDGVDEVEIMYALPAEEWGQGFATELARAVVEIAFARLGLAQIVGFTLPHNLASRRVLEKSGFVYEREVVYRDLLHVLYRQHAPSVAVG